MKFLLTLSAVIAVITIAQGQQCTDKAVATAECECGSGKIKCKKDETCDATGGSAKTGECKPAATSGGGGGAAAAPPAPLRCQNKDGSLLPSATICADKLDPATCEAVFGGGAAGGGSAAEVDCKKEASKPEPADCNCKQGEKGNTCKAGSTCDVAGTCTPGGGKRRKRQAAAAGGDKRSDKCDLPDLADMALQCAKTCKICCETAEHGCEDDQSFGIDCQQQKTKCKLPQWTAVMSTACPLTCGLCNSGACKDTVAGCSSLKTLCRDFTYRAYMEQNCARTCKSCDRNGGGAVPPAANCVNTGFNCANFTNWCQGPADQQSSMRTHCPKTCGFC